METIHYFKLKNTDEEPSKEFYETLVEILERDNSGIVVNEFTSHEVLYTFLEKEKVLRLKNLFESYDLLIDDKELTQEVLKTKFMNDEFQETFSDAEYSRILEDFMFRNLTVDDVLDKISASGYESLTSLEKQILKAA